MTSTTALITGANKGIGRETARQLLAQGWRVWIGSRDPERGAAAVAGLAGTAADHAGEVRLVQLDVTDDTSVAAAADVLKRAGGLDVLINNAGVGGPRKAAADTVAGDFLATYGVNLLGPVRMTQALLPLLRESARPRIVNVSSGMGSFSVTTDPDRFESTLHGLVYPSAKAALNMVTSQYAKALPEICVVAVDPGYTATDLNDHHGQQPIEVGAAPVVAAARGEYASGSFTGQDGPVAW